MRWRYPGFQAPHEVAARELHLAKMDSWWREFAGKTQALTDLFENKANWDLPDWMHQNLGAVSPHLMWEYGPALCGLGHRLVITPESRAELRPMVQVLLERAPKLPGWEFYAYRPPENLEMAVQTVEARAHGDLRETLVAVTAGRHHRIDLRFYSPTTRGPDDRQASHNAFVAIETLLGEEVLDQWIGCIDVQPLPKPSGLARLIGRTRKPDPSLLPLARLKPTTDALIASILEQLPEKPLYRTEAATRTSGDQRIGAVFQLKPTVADDYPERRDLLVAVSTNEDLWVALHARDTFCSARYSRCGETFCYLKIDGKDGLDKDEFPDRGSIEDALDEILIPAGAGATIGGGTGLRYSYIDLALADVNAAIPLITTRLRAGHIPRRSWLLFFDPPLRQEWIGMYDDTPEPPAIALPPD